MELQAIGGRELPEGIGEKELLLFLRHASVIAPLIKTSILYRLTTALLLIFGGAAIVPFNLSGYSISGASGLDWSDPPVFLVQILLVFAVRLNAFLKPSERRFLANVTGLHHIFFKRYVSPAIEAFNESVAKSPLFNLVERVVRLEQERIKQLLTSATEDLGKQDDGKESGA